MPYRASVSSRHFTAVILSALLGGLGVDRLYLGRPGLGVAKILASVAYFALFLLIWDISDYSSLNAVNLVSGLFLLPTSLPELLALPVTVWFTIDTALIGLGKARDGHGNQLISYGAVDDMGWRRGDSPYEALISPKHQIAVILSVIPITGLLGVDRFYIGRKGLGILKILTLGGFGVWMLVDNILIANGRARDKTRTPLITAYLGQPTP